MPSCNSLEYDGEISSAPLLAPIQGLPHLNDQEIQDISIMQIFFRQRTIRAFKRDEITDFDEILCKKKMKYFLFKQKLKFHFFYILQQTLEASSHSSWDLVLYQ